MNEFATTPLPASDIPGLNKTIYPAPFAAQVAGRIKQRLGDHFGLANFGVNLTELKPGAVSALLHHHAKQDEFVYIVAGTPTLVLGDKEYAMKSGDCCGFKAGNGLGHQLVNRSQDSVFYLEVGDRTPNEQVVYPNDDLMFATNAAGKAIIAHKDGTPY
jgi:uncharacterized cupin superfamily protein